MLPSQAKTVSVKRIAWAAYMILSDFLKKMFKRFEALGIIFENFRLEKTTLAKCCLAARLTLSTCDPSIL